MVLALLHQLDRCLTPWSNTGGKSQLAVCDVAQAQEDPMTRPIFSASTLPVEPAPDRLLLFIQQAQLTLLYSECSSKSALNSDREARVAA
jgi:hypothetical protein